MDPEFSRLVDKAANIAASGRWAAVNERIEHRAANPGADNDQWVQQFASLCLQIFSEYVSLKRAYKEKLDEVSLLAWRARNLLELSVWCLYCAKSRETRAVFTRTPDVGYWGFSVLSQSGDLQWQKTPTGSIFLQERSKTFPNRLLRTGLRPWMALTNKSARRLKNLESVSISLPATKYCPNSLTLQQC